MAERPIAVDWVRGEAPKRRGTGLFVGAGSMLFATVVYQLGDALLCGGCSIGLTEHAFLSVGLGMAAGGGAMRGGFDAFQDASLRRTREPRRAIAAGVGTLLAGLALGVANDAMALRCSMNAAGPYAADDNCRFGVSRVLMDASAVAVGTGAGLLAWGLRYRRHARLYKRARVAFSPGLQRTGATLGLSGRF